MRIISKCKTLNLFQGRSGTPGETVQQFSQSDFSLADEHEVGALIQVI